MAIYGKVPRCLATLLPTSLSSPHSVEHAAPIALKQSTNDRESEEKARKCMQNLTMWWQCFFKSRRVKSIFDVETCRIYVECRMMPCWALFGHGQQPRNGSHPFGVPQSSELLIHWWMAFNFGMETLSQLQNLFDSNQQSNMINYVKLWLWSIMFNYDKLMAFSFSIHARWS